MACADQRLAPYWPSCPRVCATASTETCGREVSSSAQQGNLVVTSWSILVMHCVSMLTTLLSAGLLRTPSHFRTWSLQAAWEPVSGKPCCSAPLSLMGRWSTHPCSGPACSELETVCGKNPLQWSPQLISARRLALSCSAWFVPIPGF
uniref:Uncharacterized protein n=1 Tax=Mus musculus TaxID=10090 RepID=Q9CWG3_MOUSE|nr:unnamed protein product [Mus musculus]